MHDGNTIAKMLRLLGGAPERAAREVGVPRATARNWAVGRVPRKRASGIIRVRTKTVEAPKLDAKERAIPSGDSDHNSLCRAILFRSVCDQYFHMLNQLNHRIGLPID